MLQESQPVNLLARSNELGFPTRYSDPQRLEINRRTANRHQSITRGTASSKAKAVRHNPASTEPTAQKKSLFRNKNQSLVLPITDKATVQRKTSLMSIKAEPTKVSARTATSDQPIVNSSNLTDSNKQQSFQRRLSRKSSAISLTKEQAVVQHAQYAVYPFESPKVGSPEARADAVAKHVEQLSTLPQSSSEHTHHHHHSVDEDLPGYMRRPICAACNRNVKVTSSSETSNMRKSSSAITASSTKSSISSRNSNSTMHRSSTKNTNSESNLELNKDSSEIRYSNHNKFSLMRNQSTSVDSISSYLSHSNNNSRHKISENHASLRSKSPSSPIPTRRKKINYKRAHTALKNHNKNALVKLSLAKWMNLLTQQQSILLALTDEKSMLLNDFDQMAIHLDNINQNQQEAIFLDIQTQILQKFASCLIQQQKQIFQYQEQQLFHYQLQEQQQIQTKIQGHMQSREASSQMTKPLDWHTKLEYDVALLKWNMSQWTGNTVGTGEVEEQEFDMLGYPKSVVVSGICVTVESGLLSKDLKKFLKPFDGQRKVICHKYRIKLTKDDRLFKFQLMKKEKWTKDKDVVQCEFSIRIDHKTNKCCKEFGFYERRHHCRSCGHVFCQMHSTNSLPLFMDNGQRGEWARVCDICFYRMIDPNLISRS